tara:strand:+ start:3244 stop:4023 length:780 start_codon:yes stop_codon:yes gene_type:complete
MSFTKSVFFISSDTTRLTAAVPATDAGISVHVDDAFLANNNATAIAAGKKFQLVNCFYSSPLLAIDNVVSAKKSDYSVGTAQVITATVVAESDTLGYIKLIDVTDGREKFSIKTFEASGTASAIATALRASILKDDNVAGTGGSGASVVITFVKDVVYRAAANAASSIAYTTAGVHSIGAAATVKAELAEGMAFKGVTNQGGTNIVSPDFSTAVNSDKIVVEVDTTVGDRTDRHEIVIYVKEGGTTKAYDDLTTILGAS